MESVFGSAKNTMRDVTRFRRRTGWIRALVLFLILAPGWSGLAGAATIFAVPTASEINVGDQISIELFVDLDAGAGEVASLFEGRFFLVGPGLMSVDPLGFGMTWDDSALPDGPNAASTNVVMSLLASSNRSDHSLLGTLLLTASAPGTISIRLDPSTFLQKDLVTAPFFEGVPIQNVPGSDLSTIVVVPEPSTCLLLGMGLLLVGKRRPACLSP